jgi:hypothetical protein
VLQSNVGESSGWDPTVATALEMGNNERNSIVAIGLLKMEL